MFHGLAGDQAPCWKTFIDNISPILAWYVSAIEWDWGQFTYLCLGGFEDIEGVPKELWLLMAITLVAGFLICAAAYLTIFLVATVALVADFVFYTIEWLICVSAALEGDPPWTWDMPD